MLRIDKNQRRGRAIIAGNMAHLGGQVAIAWTADIWQQTRETPGQSDALRTEAGTSWHKIVTATI